MKRRLVVIVSLVLGLSAAGTAAQAILPASTQSSYWGCVGTRYIDFGVCVENPLPERLPVPS